MHLWGRRPYALYALLSLPLLIVCMSVATIYHTMLTEVSSTAELTCATTWPVATTAWPWRSQQLRRLIENVGLTQRHLNKYMKVVCSPTSQDGSAGWGVTILWCQTQLPLDISRSTDMICASFMQQLPQQPPSPHHTNPHIPTALQNSSSAFHWTAPPPVSSPQQQLPLLLLRYCSKPSAAAAAASAVLFRDLGFEVS